MTTRLTVWCLGSKATLARSAEGEPIRFAAEPSGRIGTLPAARLRDRLSETTTDLVGFVDAGGVFSASAFAEALQILDDEPALAGVIVSADLPLSGLNRWEQFPLPVAALMHPLGPETALVARRSALDGDLAEMPAPLWDWLIRAVRDRRPFAVVPVKQQGDRVESIAFLPDLSPRAPGRDRAWLAEHLQKARPEELVREVRSRPDALAVKAGLLQLHDHLDESHAISQSIEGEGRHRAGDYWHAIMHRREPDDSNSSYWYRRVGRHRIFPRLAERGAAILAACPSAAAQSWQTRLLSSGDWDPFAFVEFCSHCRRSADDDLTRAARQVQLLEMELLLHQTVQDAGG